MLMLTLLYGISVTFLSMNGVQAIPGKCRYCFKTISRKDNLRRHENETCNKIRVLCECGKKIRKSSLSRHLQKYCSSKTIELQEVQADANEQQLQTNEMPQEFQPILYCNTDEQHAQDGNTVRFKIQTELSVTKNDDGTIVYSHEPIEIDGIQMVLVPASSLETNESTENESSNGKFYVIEWKIYSFHLFN